MWGPQSSSRRLGRAMLSQKDVPSCQILGPLCGRGLELVGEEDQGCEERVPTFPVCGAAGWGILMHADTATSGSSSLSLCL